MRTALRAGTRHVAGRTITRSRIAGAAIGQEVLENRSVGKQKLGRGAVTQLTIQKGAVASIAIEAGAVVSINLADGAVITSKLADTAVTTAKVFDDAITAIWTNTGDTPSTGTFASIPVTRTAGTELIIQVTWASVAVDPTVGADLTIAFTFSRDATPLDTTIAFLCLFDPDFTGGAGFHISTGGPYGSQCVDDDAVSGSFTYNFTMIAGEINAWRITMLERKK